MSVVLAHIGVAWLLTQQDFRNAPSIEGEVDHVIMANVVMDVPAQTTHASQPVGLSITPRPQSPSKHPVQPLLDTSLSTIAPLSAAAPVTGAVDASSVPSNASSSSSHSPSTATTETHNPRPSTRLTTTVEPSSDADYLHNPAPAYPRMSRRMGEQGLVVVRVLINTEGRAEQAEIRTSSGYNRLDEAALETVKRWRYVPGQRAGIPETMWFNVPIRFRLD